jgi:hypothetical protein
MLAAIVGAVDANAPAASFPRRIPPYILLVTGPRRWAGVRPLICVMVMTMHKSTLQALIFVPFGGGAAR